MPSTVLRADLAEKAVSDSGSEAEVVRLRRRVEQLQQEL